MKKNNHFFVFALFAAFLFSAGATNCKAETADTLILARNAVELADTHDRYVLVKVTSNNPVKLKSKSSWLKAEVIDHKGRTKIKISADSDNTSPRERRGMIFVYAGSEKQIIDVVQGKSGDYWKEGDVLMLREHKRGKGVAVVLSGDGFDSGDLRKGGKYETECRDLVDTYLFTTPIYEDFEDLFDVYVAMSESHERGVERGTDNAFGSRHCDFDAAARKITSYGIPENRAWIFIGNGMIGGYALFEHRAGIYSTEEPNKAYWMAHEFGGHGFALLADEYVSDCNYMGGPRELRRMQDKLDWCMNVADTDDLTKVPWKDFIGRTGYENVGAYKGGFYCAEGVWRPEEYSIMVHGNGKRAYFNSMSRWLIYKKIHELASLDFSFETFLEYDKKFIRK